MQADPGYIEDLLVRGIDDWVHLSEAMSVARDQPNTPNVETAMQMCIAAIQQMLDRELAVVGDLVRSGARIEFRPWAGTNAEALQLIGAELEKSQGLPELSGRHWLANTEKGDAVAHART
jgi:hypothetical protein